MDPVPSELTYPDSKHNIVARPSQGGWQITANIPGTYLADDNSRFRMANMELWAQTTEKRDEIVVTLEGFLNRMSDLANGHAKIYSSYNTTVRNMVSWANSLATPALHEVKVEKPKP